MTQDECQGRTDSDREDSDQFIQELRDRRMREILDGRYCSQPVVPFGSNAFFSRVILPDGRIRNEDYRIESHRPLAGPLLVRGRSLIYDEICRSMDPVIRRQEAFNLNVTENLRMIIAMIERLERNAGIVPCPSPSADDEGSAHSTVVPASWEPFLALVRKNLHREESRRAGIRILCAGMAASRMSVTLAAEIPGEYWCVADDPALIAACRQAHERQGSRGRFICADPADLGALADGYFDAGILTGLLDPACSSDAPALLDALLTKARRVVFALPLASGPEGVTTCRQTERVQPWGEALADAGFLLESLEEDPSLPQLNGVVMRRHAEGERP